MRVLKIFFASESAGKGDTWKRLFSHAEVSNAVLRVLSHQPKASSKGEMIAAEVNAWKCCVRWRLSAMKGGGPWSRHALAGPAATFAKLVDCDYDGLPRWTKNRHRLKFHLTGWLFQPSNFLGQYDLLRTKPDSIRGCPQMILRLVPRRRR